MDEGGRKNSMESLLDFDERDEDGEEVNEVWPTGYSKGNQLVQNVTSD